VADPRPCVVCTRPQDDVLHGPERSGAAGRAHPAGVISHHEYDPGERRVVIRRMADRVRAIEDVTGQPVATERRQGRERRA